MIDPKGKTLAEADKEKEEEENETLSSSSPNLHLSVPEEEDIPTEEESNPDSSLSQQISLAVAEGMKLALPQILNELGVGSLSSPSRVDDGETRHIEERLSHGAASREASMDPLDDWEEPLNQDQSIPPNPGFVQRYVRADVNGEPDYRNISKRLAQGWRTRSADALPADVMRTRLKHPHFGDTEVIGTRGNVLMEIPQARYDRLVAINRRKADQQMRAVHENLYRVHEPGSGYGRPEVVEHTSKREYGGGRRPAIPEED